MKPIDTSVAASRPIRIVTYSTLFPNSAQPGWGIFVETRLRHLLASGEVQSRVLAPVPWFPWRHERFGRYADFARAPQTETRCGIEVLHPRYPLIPKVGMTVAPMLLATFSAPSMRRLIRAGYDFDVIDAHYYYPDGVAAAILGRWFGKPVVITARGTDINLLPRYRVVRRMILWAERQAAASITVCQALKDEMIALGAAPERISVLRNGVDLETFAPVPQAEARAALGLPIGPLALSVGYLIERKGHHLAIEALVALPDWRLVIVGSGVMDRQLRELAHRLGVSERVRFAGEVPQHRLRDYYSAADALILASNREGMANVLLESLACGTPVVATRLWGTPEVIAAAEAGELMDERSAPALAAALERLHARPPARAATRRYAEQFSWGRTTRGQIELFSGLLRAASPRAPVAQAARR